MDFSGIAGRLKDELLPPEGRANVSAQLQLPSPGPAEPYLPEERDPIGPRGVPMSQDWLTSSMLQAGGPARAGAIASMVPPGEPLPAPQSAGQYFGAVAEALSNAIQRGGMGVPKTPSIWRRIPETFTPGQKEAAEAAWQAAGRTGRPSFAQTRLQSMERAVPPETTPTLPGALTTPGQRTPAQILGPTGEAAQQEMIGLKRFDPRALTRRDTRQLYQDVMGNAPASAEHQRMYQLGQELERWYVHSYDEIAALIKRFKSDLPPALSKEIDLSSDPKVLAQMVAATSVQKAPGPNVKMSLDAFIDWLRKGKPEQYMTDIEAFMPAHRGNIARAVAGEPLGGQKVGSYGLNILGSEWNTTIDRWMVRVLLGRPTTAANLTRTDYQLASDRLIQLAQQFETTPARVQAALWTGAKVMQDSRIYRMLRPEIAASAGAKGAGTGMLTVQQAVPALADQLRYWGNRVIDAGALDPKLLTNPGIAMATLLLALDKEKEKPPTAAPKGGS